MKTFLSLFLAIALTAAAQAPATSDDAKTWMIQHFEIPADAEITLFLAMDSPVTSATISWNITSADGHIHGHSRIYDFQKQAVTYQFDH